MRPRAAAISRISFETAKLVFEDPYHVSVRDRVVGGEERWQTFGMVGGGILVVAHAYWEEDEEEVIRMISARQATGREKRAYEEAHEESV